MTSISYTLDIGQAVHRQVDEHLTDLMVTARGLPQRRYAQSHQVWRTARVVSNGFHFELDLRDWKEELLWDLWGVIPRYHEEIRRRLVKFLERSPLIKLAECAD